MRPVLSARIVIVFFLLLLTLPALAALTQEPAILQAADQPPPTQLSPQPEYVEGEVLVKFKSTPVLTRTADTGYATSQFSTINSILKDFPVRHITSLTKGRRETGSKLDRFVKITLDVKSKGLTRPSGIARTLPFSDETEEFKLIQRLKQDPNVEFAELNYTYRTTETPNDSLSPQQWHLPQIQAPEGWDITIGDASVVIAVVDTGIDYLHEDLEGRIWQNQNEIPDNGIDDDENGYIDDVRGWDFVDTDSPVCDPSEDCKEEDNEPADSYGHGTHVAGIAAAASNNGKGVAGVCWNCKLMNLRAGWKGTDGLGRLTLEAIEKAIYYAIDNNAEVVNMSFGGPAYSAEINDALREAYNEGIILVASAGNENTDLYTFPSHSDYTISVAATDSQDSKDYFSNYGARIDIAAPGVDILSLRAEGTDMYGDGQNIVADKYYLASGTSMSAPIVSGVFGLVKTQHPDWGNRLFEKFVRLVVDRVNSDVRIGYGRINLYKAVATEFPAAKAFLYYPLENTQYLLPLTDPIAVSGDAIGAGYKLEFGEGYYPSQWTTIVEQNTPIDTGGGWGNLGTWDTANLEEKLYTVKLTVLDNQGGFFHSQSFVEFYDPQLGWSRELSSRYSSAPTVADLDNDGQKEILLVSASPEWSNELNLYIFNANGDNFLSQNPIRLEGGYGGYSAAPAVGDIDQDGTPEIVVAGENGYENPYSKEGVIYILKNNGVPLSGWNPRRVDDEISLESRWCPGWEFADRPCGGFPSSPVIANMDNDQELEVVLLSRYGKLYVFNLLGDNVQGFPLLLGEGYWFGNTFNTPAVGDVDGDEKPEIVATLGETYVPEKGTFVYLVEDDGSINRPAWPKRIVGDNTMFTYYSSLYSPPVIGNVDSDEQMEIFVASWNEHDGTVHGWKYNGSPITSKWPVLAKGVVWNVSLGRKAESSSMVILAGGSRSYVRLAYAISPEGKVLAGWPPSSTVPVYILGQPLVVNLDGDTDNEFLFVSELDKQVFAYKSSGNYVAGWPKPLREPTSRTPSIADLDLDGVLELVVTGYEGRLLVKKLPESPLVVIDWGTFHHDERHTGAYTSPTPPQSCGADLNCDGTTDLNDISLWRRIWANPTSADRTNADLDSNGSITILDYLRLLRRWLEL